MRTGAEYREALRDGRRVWVLDDARSRTSRRTPPPARSSTSTRPGDRSPWGYVVPKRASDFAGMGRCFAKTTFLSAGT